MTIRRAAHFVILFLCYSATFFPNTPVATVNAGNLRVLPLAEHETFFKSISRIRGLPDGTLLVADNLESVLLDLSRQGQVLRRIGSPGQGPGDLNHPYHLWVGDSQIIVSDDSAISRFDFQGRYIDRFKKFRSICGLAASNNRAFIVEENTDSLVTVYDLAGKKCGAFGKRYRISDQAASSVPSAIPDWVLQMGSVLYHDGYVYFVSHLFGDVLKYDLAGHLVKENRDIGSATASRNKDVIFNEKVKKFSINNRVFNDVIASKNKLYALEYAKTDVRGTLWEIDCMTLLPTRKIQFSSPEPNQLIECLSLQIQPAANEALAFVAFYDVSRGDYLIGRVGIDRP